MEYKYLPKDLATRLTEVTADVLNDALHCPQSPTLVEHIGVPIL